MMKYSLPNITSVQVNNLVSSDLNFYYITPDCQDEFQAPRAGLEPATKRLTAAHSTIELPGNEYLRTNAQIRWR
jgi:hypothetical protein